MKKPIILLSLLTVCSLFLSCEEGSASSCSGLSSDHYFSMCAAKLYQPDLMKLNDDYTPEDFLAHPFAIVHASMNRASVMLMNDITTRGSIESVRISAQKRSVSSVKLIYFNRVEFKDGIKKDSLYLEFGDDANSIGLNLIDFNGHEKSGIEKRAAQFKIKLEDYSESSNWYGMAEVEYKISFSDDPKDVVEGKTKTWYIVASYDCNSNLICKKSFCYQNIYQEYCCEEEDSFCISPELIRASSAPPPEASREDLKLCFPNGDPLKCDEIEGDMACNIRPIR